MWNDLVSKCRAKLYNRASSFSVMSFLSPFSLANHEHNVYSRSFARL